ncbi:MAG: hypothetical protein IPP34_07765 [Bacteroidetes bacterium]|nr:hypothetical protein [Bacteroidota bacterium]
MITIFYVYSEIAAVKGLWSSPFWGIILETGELSTLDNVRKHLIKQSTPVVLIYLKLQPESTTRSNASCYPGNARSYSGSFMKQES